MKKQIQAIHSDNNNCYNDIFDLATSCPICGVRLKPDVISATVLVDEEEDEELNKGFILNYCSECNECFISRHTYNSYLDIYEFDSSAPMNYYKQSFSPDIEKLSPDFVSIYNDSLHAESLGMTSICGMGYRKSLEFLVKDFAISNNPDSEQEITKLALAKCIDTYIDNRKLKSLAKASAWLGNDETHYVRKHPKYGIAELKAFINAFVTFIDAELAYANALILLEST